jgi:hypothetical protein
MQREAVKMKSGAMRYRAVMTTEEYQSLTFGLDNPGFCLDCGEEAYGVEPDARRYRCEACGLPGVFGLEELLMMGLIRFTEETAA